MKMKLEEQILDWIETKDFDALTAAEQEMVLSTMTEESYSARRSFIQNAAHAFETEKAFITPNLETQHKLKLQLRAKNSSGKMVPFYLRSVSIKFYQVAAVVLFFCMVWWNSGETIAPEVIAKEKIVYQTKVDTVFLETKIEVPVVQIKEVIKYKELPVAESTFDVQYTSVELPMPQEQKEIPNLTDLEQEIGNSPFSNDELNQFRRGI